ncbi:MAG: class II aldolase/adducin family protein [Rhodospirillaceae bacterium]|nr:class II aldolase/adducin family protein [Rhodospirillaceae bacterium]
MSADDLRLKLQLIDTCRALRGSGLTHGTSGNVSVRRDAQSLFISPTGADYDTLRPQDIPLLHLDGRWSGGLKPSSEWRFHRDIMRTRNDVNAVVHTHSTYATALACTEQGIPAFHYMVAIAGGADIRCAPYATFGTEELSRHALAALHRRRACLLANHGVIALGRDLAEALKLAGEVENLAAQYLTALRAGAPRLLPQEEMDRVVEKFRTYGHQDGTDDQDLKHDSDL